MMTPDEATKAMEAMTAMEAAIKPRLDTPMRQYHPAKYEEIRKLMLECYHGQSAVLRLHYDIDRDALRYVFASSEFYDREYVLFADSVAWEKYDEQGNLIDRFETPQFRETLRRKLNQESHWNPAAEAVLPPWQAVDYAAPQQAAAQQAQLGCISKGPVTEAVFKAGSLADYYFNNLGLGVVKPSEAQLRAAGINVQKEPAPELWWQTEQRLAAVKRDELVVMRADVRRMLMGG